MFQCAKGPKKGTKKKGNPGSVLEQSLAARLGADACLAPATIRKRQGSFWLCGGILAHPRTLMFTAVIGAFATFCAYSFAHVVSCLFVLPDLGELTLGSQDLEPVL